MNSLENARAEIDQIDRQLVALLEKRLTAVNQIAKYKQENKLPILDSTREKQVLEKIAGYVSNESYQETISQTFDQIMKQSKIFQKQQMEESNGRTAT